MNDIGELSEVIPAMAGLEVLSFKENPIAKSPKYRDFVVILSKTLLELDGKKILPEEREYLVKLYARKHTKQEQNAKPKVEKKGRTMDLQGVKVKEERRQSGTNINTASDLRGIVPFANTKHTQTQFYK
jgi:hypothetical protein